MKTIINELIFLSLFSLLTWLVYCLVTDFRVTLHGLLDLVAARLIKTHFFDKQK
ncbi:hypothetical protein [Levilactobacillus huananensis]|uniref:hypothetical protein n=1 Tax=Levilactobacillus huananensis TaxID=2486019 RepID=UPI0013DDF573|nr:hypothetical protein [Levilactobacillus huananensis]